MAKTYYIYKDSYNRLYYRDASTNIQGGYLPKEVRTAEQMRQHFGKGQRFNEVNLVFKTPSDQLVKYYTIKRGSDFAQVDFENKFSFNLNLDVANYLRNYVPDEVCEEADGIDYLENKIEFLKTHASPETLAELQTYITGLNSDESLIARCKDHAKKYHNMDNISVEFTD